ncbi:MAG: Kazal-type serine protease inhibitor domain-containing protein [Nitrospirota bacterium]
MPEKTVFGTVARGAPIAGAKVTVKEATGSSTTTTTLDNGEYAIDGNITVPFLVKVDLPKGGALFSIGYETGVVNIHPLTQLILKVGYKATGKTIDAGFNDFIKNPPPAAAHIKKMAKIVISSISEKVASHAINPDSFDLMTTPFEANNAGFDAVLDDIVVGSDGSITMINQGVEQVIMLTPDPATGRVSVDSLIGGVLTNREVITIAIVSPVMDTAFPSHEMLPPPEIDDPLGLLPPPPVLDCPSVYEPVCGNDGISYENACNAERSGMPIIHDGVCDENSAPPPIVDPFENSPDSSLPPIVTDLIGDNKSPEAPYVDQTVTPSPDDPLPLTDPDCPSSNIFCIQIYDPVCGVDGKTYGNACEAMSACVSLAYLGECNPGNREETGE